MNISWAVVFVLLGALAFGYYASKDRPPPPKIQVVKTIAIPHHQFVHKGEMK